MTLKMHTKKAMRRALKREIKMVMKRDVITAIMRLIAMNRKLNQYILNFIHKQAISYILAIDFFSYQILQLHLPM